MSVFVVPETEMVVVVVVVAVLMVIASLVVCTSVKVNPVYIIRGWFRKVQTHSLFVTVLGSKFWAFFCVAAQWLSPLQVLVMGLSKEVRA